LGLVYSFAKGLFDERTALVAGGLFALAPFQVHYAQEIRMYALLACLLLGATYALWQGMQTARLSWWLIFCVLSASAQYTHNLAAFYLVPLALIPVMKRAWRAALWVAFSGLGALGLYSPWLLRLPEQFARVSQGYWTTRPSVARLITTLLSFVTNLPVPDAWLPAALFVSLSAVIVGGWSTFRAWQSGQKGVRRAAWMAYLGFVPALLLFLFSLWQPVYIERALLPSGVAFLLWLAWVITHGGMPKPVRAAMVSLLALGMLLGVYHHVTYAGFPYGPYPQIAQALAATSVPDERVLHSNKLTMLPMVYYDRDLPQAYLADPAGSGSDTLSLPTQQVLGLVARPEIETAVGDAQRKPRLAMPNGLS
jgi:uncharacterized membrane protein